MNKIKIISFYHFFKPNYDLNSVSQNLRNVMVQKNLKGTILLAQEGINGSVAGAEDQMDSFMNFLQETIGVKLSSLKVNYSHHIPFKRVRVKVKDVIVPEPGDQPVDISQNAAPYLSPEALHQWIKDGKEIIMLDTRNDYEYQAGRFKDSVHLGTKHFADFEGDLKNTPPEWKNTPIVTFCTGGIRCEKAAPLMVQKGFGQVYQLEGGILNYFEKVGQGYFEGGCFVFDERISISSSRTAA